MHAGNRIYFQALNGYYFTKLIITKTIGIPVVVNQMELESTYCGTLTEDNVSTAVNFPSNLYISYVPIIITDNTTIMHISYELAQKGY